MASKALFLLALLASAAVLATAAEQTHDNKETNNAGVNDHGEGGGHGSGGGGYCRHGCCRRGYHGGCQQCCRTPDEVPEVKN
ncbi:glycine-rich cell wall structural protein-like [Phragmites australis]|uniref:glycine-rich cell wall structural protein-like n=1 Tax=Phragmites australis TaxID=29695 RepID=UPI002D769812|nr:glycine-rich cell wall structural protein-like [Phragmites australis]